MAQFGNGMFDNDMFTDFLEDVPSTGFFSAIKPFGTSPRRRQFFENQFQPMYNRYQGEWGQQVRQGQFPTLRFDDFLSNRDFSREFMEQPRYNRGVSSTFFNPRTRLLYGF